jgi:polysaccharide export outer membrane protein
MMTTFLLITLLFGHPQGRGSSSGIADYVIGSADVLTITVVGEPDLTKQYTIDRDGTFDFPWIGRIRAQGFTLRALEEAIFKRLVEGKFLTRPQVSIQVQEFRSQSVYVMGQVREQGMVPLTGTMTIVDLLSSRLLPDAGDDIVINRRRGDAQDAAGPVLDGKASDVDVIRISKLDILSGRAARMVTLKHGDTIVVNKAASVYIYGQVKSSGAFTLDGKITVLQALALAGGATDRGAVNRLTILRIVDGKQKTIKVKLTDYVQPGDTINVPAKRI